ncbi:hypothetical protein SKAU_G00146250 [Synaphobranchus kaupii]|uniref:ZP domain-containing protein n=1 Tax=Synaphobranchus kaupii TaxID=118154 RepID=A0A9Q1J3S8_SYNKA|nr:hypothetical protein SKAU_G00146250 [Synaphobranchus kaupii]
MVYLLLLVSSTSWCNLSRQSSVFFMAFKMRTAVFCMCLLGYVSFSAGARSEPENDWQEQKVTLPSKKARTKQTKSAGYKLPPYIHGDDAPAVTEQMGWFHYNAPGPLTDEAKAVMLPTTTVAPVTIKDPIAMVEALCHMDRMYVRIRKDSVSERDGWKYLYFGTCRVNQARDPHYYFLYPLASCGLIPQVMDDSIVFTNLVRYLHKPTDRIDIIRIPSLAVPVACKYPRFHRTYDVGIHPILGTNYSKILPSGRGPMYILILDANWNPLPPGAIFELAQAIHFEVRVGAGMRAFVNRCWITPTSNPFVLLPFTPIKYYGCMVDGMESSLSRYYIHTDPAILRFSIESFVFPMVPATQMLTIHCEVTTGKIPTPFRKACSLNKISNMWEELDRKYDRMCDCCNTGCTAAKSGAKVKTISSESWNVGDFDDWEAEGELTGDFDEKFPDEWSLA